MQWDIYNHIIANCPKCDSQKNFENRSIIGEDMDNRKVPRFCDHPVNRLSQKSIPDIFDCNFKKSYQILIISGVNIPQLAIK